MPAPTTSARASAWEWTRTALLSANIAWTTLCLGGFLPGTKIVMAALTALLVAVHFFDPRSGGRAHPAGWLFIPFIAYAAANVLWVTPVRWLGWGDWLNWAQAVAVFWVVLNGIESPSCRRFLCATLIAIGAASAVLATYQHYVKPDWLMLGRTQAEQFIGRSSGPFGIPNSLGVLMALLIPPVGALALGRGRPASVRALCAAALFLLAAGFVFAVSRGAWLALAAAFALRPLVVSDRSPGRRIAAAAAAVLAAASAATILYFSYPLMRARVDQLVRDSGEITRPILWRGAFRIFEAHPVFGGGAGSFDALFEEFRPVGFRDRPIYAHCDYINTLADYGLVGFVLFFGAAGIIAWQGARARGLAGAAYTGLIAFALHLLVDFHLKIPALAIIVATVAALVTAEAWLRPNAGSPGRRASGPARAVALCVGIGVLALTFAWVVPKHRAEDVRRLARERIDKMAAAGTDVSKEGGALFDIDSALARSLLLDASNAQAWSDKAYADSLLALVEPGRTAELGAQVEREASRAVELAPVIAEFWIRKGTGLDMQGRWIDGGECFVQALRLAPNRADVWYYQAYHMSLTSIEKGPAMAAAAIALRLDPGFLLAQVLRQRLGARP
jgi:hypothetical protein